MNVFSRQHAGDTRQPGPLSSGADLSLRRSAWPVRGERDIRRPLLCGTEELWHAMYWSLQVSRAAPAPPSAPHRLCVHRSSCMSEAPSRQVIATLSSSVTSNGAKA